MGILPHLSPPSESQANRGMDFERMISQVCSIYEARGVACVRKNYVRSTVVGDGKWARVDGSAIVDYSGAMKGGRIVAFDAKDNAGPSIRLDRLQPHQVEYLRQIDWLGGAAFVLTRFNRRDVYRVPISAWVASMDARRFGPPVFDAREEWHPTGKASINMNELPDAWRVDGIDWLRGLI